MLLRHSLIYLIGRGIPGIIGFVTIVVYTRLMSPETYGLYALVISASILVNALLYQWLNASLLRFLPQYRDNPSALLTSLLAGFACVSLLAPLGGAGLILWRDGPGWDRLVLFTVLLIWVQSWFTLNLELARSRLLPAQYGLMSLLRTGVSLGLGVVLVVAGYGAYGALAGLIIGYLIPGLWVLRKQWSGINLFSLEGGLIKKVLAYGLPLTASYALIAVINSTDRFMLAGLVNESATGLYVAGQGLAQQAVGVLMMMVNLAAYPIVVNALENGGAQAARTQLRKNIFMLLGVGLPMTCLFILLAAPIASVFLGEGFREAAVEIMPWVALGALLSGARAYYFDLAFYLGRRTGAQVVIMVVAALVNVVLNFLLIPRYGLTGAAYASVVAHGAGLLLSMLIGRRIFSLPLPFADFIKLGIAVALMSIYIYLLPPAAGLSGVVWVAASAGLVYAACLLASNACGVRETIHRVMGRRVPLYRILVSRYSP